VRAASAKGLTEEAPAAYKDVDEVVDIMAETGVAAKVARLVPIAIVKG
jgi:tRNA-splicing ligase RtcB (3'-phosphate/5'-hydroxy nucleic acid ligase)